MRPTGWRCSPTRRAKASPERRQRPAVGTADRAALGEREHRKGKWLTTKQNAALSSVDSLRAGDVQTLQGIVCETPG